MYAQNSILCQFGNLEICPNFANPYLTQFSSIFGGNCIIPQLLSAEVVLCTHKTTILCQVGLSCHQLTTISPSILNHFWWELYQCHLWWIQFKCWELKWKTSQVGAHTCASLWMLASTSHSRNNCKIIGRAGWLQRASSMEQQVLLRERR